MDNNIYTPSALREKISVTEGSFLYEMQDGEFHKGLYNEIVYHIWRINESDISDEVRAELTMELLEFSLEVSMQLSYHVDPNDVARISNLSREEEVDLSNSIRHLANFFKHKNKIDEYFMIS